jgi:Icc-related predicted phosphoesterase
MNLSQKATLMHLLSDLHLEFNDFELTTSGDILLLCGDIFVAAYTEKTPASKYYARKAVADKFFEQARKNYKHVIYVLGNHEHYDGTRTESAVYLRKHYPWVEILEDDYVDIGDTRYVGGTLWTSLNNGSMTAVGYANSMMNDYRLIKERKVPFAKFTPLTSMYRHRCTLEAISKACEGHDKVVVLTHHAPSAKSIDEKFSDPMYTDANYSYYSDLDDFILARPQIKLWCHGHMHSSKDYMIGTTRVVCNPHGYRDENPDFIKELAL